jgi:DNA-directed RNA polymerase specialized sigma24 family protein
MTRQPGRTLTALGLAGLLERLDADRERAGEKYEALRRRLTGYFEWRGAPHPEEHADETLDRLMRRLEQGERIDNLAAYAHGMARRVVSEALRQRERARRRGASLPTGLDAHGAGGTLDDADARAPCLEACLGALPGDERELVLAYYQDGAGGHISARRALAERRALAPHMLRARVFRIRARLELCMRGCLQRRTAQPARHAQAVATSDTLRPGSLRLRQDSGPTD